MESGEAAPQPQMSVKEAMAYHSEPLEVAAEFADAPTDLPTTVELVEIEVALPKSAVGSM